MDHDLTARTQTAVATISPQHCGLAEVERALASHPQVEEVVVVPIAFEQNRGAFSAFVTLKPGMIESDALRAELGKVLMEAIGVDCFPENIHFASTLPKTRSGKIMRDILGEMAGY
jgi:acetyl-CoA synthetase